MAASVTYMQSSAGPDYNMTALYVESTEYVHQILSAAFSSCFIFLFSSEAIFIRDNHKEHCSFVTHQIVVFLMPLTVPVAIETAYRLA